MLFIKGAPAAGGTSAIEPEDTQLAVARRLESWNNTGRTWPGVTVGFQNEGGRTGNGALGGSWRPQSALDLGFNLDV